eukprot:15274649-Alexandrium_andersonii.AAC.1
MRVPRLVLLLPALPVSGVVVCRSGGCALAREASRHAGLGARGFQEIGEGRDAAPAALRCHTRKRRLGRVL